MNLFLILVLMLTAVSLFRGTEWYRRNGRRVSATVTKIAELTQPIAPLQPEKSHVGWKIWASVVTVITTVARVIWAPGLPEGSNLGWKIWATWIDPTDLQTKKTYTFSGIATKKPPYTQGASINVFIDPNNMKRYDLDLD